MKSHSDKDKKNQKPSTAIKPSEIKLIQDVEPFNIWIEILHLMPFLNKKKREPNFDKTLESPWGKVRILARETLNSYDAKVFTAFSRLIYDSHIRDAGIINYADGTSVEVSSVLVTPYSFLKDYLHTDPHQSKNIKQAWNGLIRLSDCTWYFETKKTKTAAKIIREIRQIKKDKKTYWEILFSKKYGETIKERKNIITLSNKQIQSLEGYTAILLYMFLKGQKDSGCYSLTTLKEALHIEEKDWLVLRSLRRAFSEAKTKGCINEWYEEKREDDIYFSYVIYKKLT